MWRNSWNLVLVPFFCVALSISPEVLGQEFIDRSDIPVSVDTDSIPGDVELVPFGAQLAAFGSSDTWIVKFQLRNLSRDTSFEKLAVVVDHQSAHGQTKTFRTLCVEDLEAGEERYIGRSVELPGFSNSDQIVLALAPVPPGSPTSCMQWCVWCTTEAHYACLNGVDTFRCECDPYICDFTCK